MVLTLAIELSVPIAAQQATEYGPASGSLVIVGGYLHFSHDRRSLSGSPCALRIEDRLERV